MGKPKTKRALKDNEAKAVLRMLRGSGQKLNLVAAQIRAPPSGRSSRATPVTTTNRRPISRTASAILVGSSSSTASGLAVITSQNPHRRVHLSPRIRNVASRSSQHSEMFGHNASSHTVCSDRVRMIPSSSR